MERKQMTIAGLPPTANNIRFIIWVVLNRLFLRFFADHPYDERFVSGDAFRSLASHHLDSNTFDPTSIRNGELVFVPLSRMSEFFTEIHPQIPCPYRLLSHNGDTNIDASFLPCIDSKIIVWWTQNLQIKHKKVHAIPIGIENLSYYNHGIPSLFDQVHCEKKMRILYGFSVHTNPIARGKALERLEKMPLAESVSDRLNAKEYMETLKRYAFVASPPGNGEDCIRTWEAVYVGTVPIVLRTPMTESFEKMNLPLWCIDDWSELTEMTEKKLQRTYESITKNCSRTALNFSFWKHRILNTYAQ